MTINIQMNPVVHTHVPVNVLQAGRSAQLAAAHRRGQHPYGLMHRDCPLCQPSAWDLARAAMERKTA